METKTYKSWWFLSVNGVISIAFGLLLLLSTEAMINGIILYFGIALFAVGVILLISSIIGIKKDKKVGMILFQSISSIVVGLLIMLAPKEDILRLFFLLIGVWAVILGIFQIALLVHFGKNISSKNTVLINGLLTIALGILLCFKPFEVAGFLARLLGVLAVLFGVIMIYLSFLLRKIRVIRGQEDEPHVL
jgi:uncharacterized membrane protein HdeD (DUF308 family)